MSVNVYRTQIQVKECIDGTPKQHYMSPDNNGKSSLRKTTDNLGCAVFQTMQDNDKLVEDKTFLEIMDRDVFQDSANSWVAPLPFRSPRSRLPNNRDQAMKRLISLRRTLDK